MFENVAEENIWLEEEEAVGYLRNLYSQELRNMYQSSNGE
jgi:hypothetical protein